jgi:hypothetical protein
MLKEQHVSLNVRHKIVKNSTHEFHVPPK